MSTGNSSIDLIPKLRQHSNVVNLTSLQKKDEFITRILYTAKHGTLYHLNTITHEHDRQEIEGPIFIVERRTSPYYEVWILNRKSITDWHHPIHTRCEIQDKFLHFQSQQQHLVITLWFHEQNECKTAGDIMNRICQHLATTTKGQQPTPIDIPTSAAQTMTPANPPHNNNNALTATSKSSSTGTNPAPSPSPRSANKTKSATNPISSSAAAAPPNTQTPATTTTSKSFNSPYAPPPPIDYNVALPVSSNSRQNDRELSQRLNGFLTTLAQVDQQHTQQYQHELKEVETKKRENKKRYEEEMKRQTDEANRIKREERAKQSASSTSSAPSTSTHSQPPFPTMLSADQLTLLQSFSSASLGTQQSAPTNSSTNLQQSTTLSNAVPISSPPVASDTGNELERNLAAAKARKAARTQSSSTNVASSSPAISPIPAPSSSVSTLPASLLFAASQSTTHPPMPMATSSPVLRPSGVPSSSTLNVSQSQSSNVHPLLAMLNQSVAVPQQQQQTTQQQLNVSYSPYTIDTTTTTTLPSHPSPIPSPTPTLLAPSHFLTAAAPSSTTVSTLSTTPMVATVSSTTPQLMTPQSLLANIATNGMTTSGVTNNNGIGVTSSSSNVKSRSEFHSYILSLCHDPPTVDWLYQRYLTRPNQHPFA